MDEVPAVAYPPLSVAARMLRVSPSTLSRRSDLNPELVGARDKRLRPSTVLRLAAYYKKAVLNSVARQLIEYAVEQDPAYGPPVEAEVDSFFAAEAPAQQITAE